MRAVFVDCTEALANVIEARALRIPDSLEIYGGALSRTELMGCCQGADVLLVEHTKLLPEVFDACPSVRTVIFLGTGAGTYIDLPEAARRGISIITTPGYGNRAVAEHALALMLAGARDIARMDREIRLGGWRPRSGLQLRGRRLAIVGLGGIGAGAHLHAETLDRDIWDSGRDKVLRGIESLVAVHRLREVSCLYGFTRFEPAPLASEDLEDVGLAVRGAALAESPHWLPAVEQFGEGIFLKFSSNALAGWLSRSAVTERTRQLQAGVDAWTEAKRRRGQPVNANSLRERERPEYIMAHSLAHALMTEVAIDCGYPASALKERVYLLPQAPGEPIQCGILIYTATAGNQGTLGGLVEVTHRFARVLESRLESCGHPNPA